jgi:hypothetical protein
MIEQRIPNIAKGYAVRHFNSRARANCAVPMAEDEHVQNECSGPDHIGRKSDQTHQRDVSCRTTLTDRGVGMATTAKAMPNGMLSIRSSRNEPYDHWLKTMNRRQPPCGARSIDWAK